MKVRSAYESPLILEKIEDVIVGTSIPYNYENSKF